MSRWKLTVNTFAHTQECVQWILTLNHINNNTWSNIVQNYFPFPFTTIAWWMSRVWPIGLWMTILKPQVWQDSCHHLVFFGSRIGQIWTEAWSLVGYPEWIWLRTWGHSVVSNQPIFMLMVKHKTCLVRVRKGSSFGSKHLVLSLQILLEISWHLVRNTKFCQLEISRYLVVASYYM